MIGAQSIDKERDALETFYAGVLPAISGLNFFYTFLFHFDQVSIFGDDPDGFERIPVISHKKGEQDFYDLISPAYTMLCAWKHSRDRTKDVLLLDSFQGRVCPAWNEFYQTAKAHVYFNGDRCNPLISTADLLTRLAKLRMLKNRVQFLEKEMDAVFPEAGQKYRKHFLGSMFLKKMCPHKRTRLDCSGLIKHPLTVIIRETPKDDQERDMIEGTPAFSELLKKAHDADGCVKFFDMSADARALTKGDVVFTIGERGEKIAKQLKKLGKDFTQESK